MLCCLLTHRPDEPLELGWFTGKVLWHERDLCDQPLPAFPSLAALHRLEDLIFRLHTHLGDWHVVLRRLVLHLLLHLRQGMTVESRRSTCTRTSVVRHSSLTVRCHAGMTRWNPHHSRPDSTIDINHLETHLLGQSLPGNFVLPVKQIGGQRAFLSLGDAHRRVLFLVDLKFLAKLNLTKEYKSP